MRNKLSEKFEIFVINLDAGDLIENFFISSIATILVVRLFLHLTGYPTIGGESLHIAHMLWGGLFMLAALFILLGFLSREAKETASLLGGIGFGLFIDELGKFITTTNDYFFEPTITLIYSIFIMLFLLVRFAEKKIKANSKTYAINGIEITKEVLLFDLDSTEKAKALKYLRRGQSSSMFIKSLIEAIEDIKPHHIEDRNYFARAKARAEKLYLNVASNKTFAKILIFSFLVISIIHFVPIVTGETPLITISGYGVLVSSLLSLALVIIGGVLFVRGSRHLGLELFKYSALVSIFITQFFLFYTDQLSAIFQLFISLTMYIATRFLLAQEKTADTTLSSRVKSLVQIFG